jgi:predicted secreted hydrolase
MRGEKSAAPAAAALLLVFAGMPAAFAQNPAPPVLPQDEAPHQGDTNEWWYFNGHLTGIDATGQTHNYGFMVSFIRNAAGLEPKAAFYNGQFAVTDLTRGTFDQDMAVFVTQPDVVPPQGGYNNTVGTWHMDGYEAVNHITAALPDNNYSINITLTQLTPAAFHGDQGIIPYGVFGVSAYYSYTNLFTYGTLVDHGTTVYITGLSWHDHQYGNFLANAGTWNWFSIQLTNDTQYMLYFLMDANRNIVQKVGTLVHPDGSTVNLDPNAMTLTPLSTWTSPVTGTTYTQNWQVTVPGGTLTATALVKNQELYIPGVQGSAYWEGDSSITGTVNGVPVTGVGYVELPPVFLGNQY